MTKAGYLLLFISLIITPFFSSAQKLKPADFGIKSKKALNLFLEGEQFAQWRDRANAIKSYKAAIELEPDFLGAYFRVGLNAHILKKYEEAIPYLEKVYKEDVESYAGMQFLLADSYFRTGAYEQSIPLFEEFLAGEKGKQQDFVRAAISIRKAKFAAKAIKDTVAFEPENMGKQINSERDEYLPFLTADDQYLLFTARRPESTGGYDPRLQDYNEDFFFSEYVDGEWKETTNLGPPINTVNNEGAASITQDGKTIFFTSCNREGGLGSCDIFMSRLEGDQWSEPENLGENVNSRDWDSQPCLSQDGKTLFFTSTRTGGKGLRDIWYCTYQNGEWMPAQNLGGPVNTEGNETSPFLHADGISLYFASDFHPGFGANDLFVTNRQSDGSWTEPLNLGFPLNTISDESNIFVSSSGKTGYINSYREGGLGRSDLYKFRLDKSIQPQVATFLRGITRDSITLTPVAARIRLIDVESGDTIRNVRSNEIDGKFLMSLPLERAYAAYAEAPGYLFVSKHFYLKNLEKNPFFDLIIDLSPIQTGSKVVLNNIFFETGDYSLQASSNTELEHLRLFLQENPLLKIEIQGHTDNVGTEEANKELSQLRAEAVRNFLLETGINEDKVIAKGYGESQPIQSNESERGRALNRRTEFKVLDIQSDK